MPRRRYIVSYDIADPKRLRQVAKTVEGFGRRLQFSVFECPLDPTRLEKLKAKLQSILNREHDQILFIDLGSNTTQNGLRIDALGLPYRQKTQLTIV